MIQYEAKTKKWLVKFDIEMSDLENQINALR